MERRCSVERSDKCGGSMSLSRTARRMERARIVDGDIVCQQHRKLLGRVTALGLELWCRGGRGHGIVLTADDLERWLLSRRSTPDGPVLRGPEGSRGDEQ